MWKRNWSPDPKLDDPVRRALPMAGGRPLRSPDSANFAAAAAAAEESIGAVGFEPGYDDTGQHVEAFENAPSLRVDAAQLGLFVLPGGMPQVTIDPGHARDETVRVDGAQDRPCLRIDLVNQLLLVLPDPERSLMPCQSGVAPRAGRRDRREHLAGIRIDLVN